MSTGTTYYPQLWVKMKIRVENFIRNNPDDPIILDAGEASGKDPTEKGVALGYAIIPYTCSVSLRSYREGNEARLEIPSGRLPVDPRVLRQASIHIYAGGLDPVTFAESQEGIIRQASLALLPETDPITGKTNEIFRGFIDDWTVVHSEDENMIQITARDATGFFLDHEFPIEALNRVPKNLTLDLAIKLLIDGEPGALQPQADIREDRQKRADSRAASKKLHHQLSNIAARLARAQAALAEDPTNAALIDEVNRLIIRQGDLQADLVEAEAEASATDALPILAARLGLPGARGTVVTNNTGGPLPTLADISGASWFDSLGQTKKGRGTGGKGKISYWDFITDLCVGAGYICYFRLPDPVLVPTAGGFVDITPPAELVIDEPRTYYKENTGQKLRRFIYGFNVDRLEVTRNYNGKNLPTSVVVSAIEDGSGRTVTGRFPPLVLNKTKRSSTAVTGTGDHDEAVRFVTNVRLPPYAAKQLLDRYAQSVYEQLSRGEMQIRIETDCLQGFLSTEFTDLGKMDMLQLRPADSIHVELAPESISDAQAVTQIGKYESLDPWARVDKLIAFGIPSNLATLLVHAEDNPLVQRVFRVQDVGINFDSETGFNFSIQAINYLDISAPAVLGGKP